MTTETWTAVVRWKSAMSAVSGIPGTLVLMEDGVALTYRTTPAGSPVAGRVAQVFIAPDGIAMTLSDGSRRHEVEAITDTPEGRIEAAHRIRTWLALASRVNL